MEGKWRKLGLRRASSLVRVLLNGTTWGQIGRRRRLQISSNISAIRRTPPLQANLLKMRRSPRVSASKNQNASEQTSIYEWVLTCLGDYLESILIDLVLEATNPDAATIDSPESSKQDWQWWYQGELVQSRNVTSNALTYQMPLPLFLANSYWGFWHSLGR